MSDTVKITAPVKTPGKVATFFGPINVTFEDGVAEVPAPLSDGLRAYLSMNGYGIDGGEPEAPEPAPEPADPRDFDTPEQVGTDLRDAAVDPEPGDFLPPTNAGQANPHSGEVVAPEVHASQGVRPVKGGPVHAEDPERQSDAELDHTEAATDGTPVEPTSAELSQAAAKGDSVAIGQLESEELKGEALDAALREANLSTSGKADEKRARLQEFRDGEGVV